MLLIEGEADEEGAPLALPEAETQVVGEEDAQTEIESELEPLLVALSDCSALAEKLGEGVLLTEPLELPEKLALLEPL